MDRLLKNISVVIPCLNESGCIAKLCQELHTVLGKLPCSYELLFVDDGSTDHSLDVLSALSDTDPRVKWISLSRNFGHQKALKAGLDYAVGDVVVTMDADMQHPPSLIPGMVGLWEKGYDVVQAVRNPSCGNSWFKRSTSHLFYRVMNALSDVSIVEGAADFRLLDRKVADALCACHEEYLFLRGMVPWLGFRQTTLPYEEDKRYAGSTKYSVRRMFMLALCGLTSFSLRPLRFAVFLAGFFALLGIVEILYVFYVVCVEGGAVSGWASLAILVSFLGASILLILGIIGEYLGKLFMQSKQRPEYIVKYKSFLR